MRELSSRVEGDVVKLVCDYLVFLIFSENSVAC